MALQVIGFFVISSCYIMRRWTKDIRSKHHKWNRNKDVFSNKEKYDLLYKKTVELLEEGSLSNESCQIARYALEETVKRCTSIKRSLKIDKENIEKNVLLKKPLLDPPLSKTKGALKWIRGGIEKGHKRTYNGRVKNVWRH